MNGTHRKNIKIFLTLACLGFFSHTQAESWELRTADLEVKGTRDIEAGRIDKGIRIMETHFAASPYAEKGAILTNLCLAYILKKQLETAATFCDRAVNHPRSSREALNNRGVLNAMLGRLDSATTDFEKAGCLGACEARTASTGKDRMDVAKRNLTRARVRLAQQDTQREVLGFSRSTQR